jgi:hypothetical protein
VIIACCEDAELPLRLQQEVEFALRVLHVPRPEFNKSLALNLGSQVAFGEAFLFLDTDVVLDSGALTLARENLAPGSYFQLAGVRESQARPPYRGVLGRVRQSIGLETLDGRSAWVDTQSVHCPVGTRAAPGLVALLRSDFLRIGGMNSALCGWGFEDVDLLLRLQIELGLTPRIQGQATHLSHGDEHRQLGSDNSRATSEQRNRILAFARYHAGLWQGTLEADWRAWEKRIVLSG